MAEELTGSTVGQEESDWSERCGGPEAPWRLHGSWTLRIQVSQHLWLMGESEWDVIDPTVKIILLKENLLHLKNV